MLGFILQGRLVPIGPPEPLIPGGPCKR